MEYQGGLGNQCGGAPTPAFVESGYQRDLGCLVNQKALIWVDRCKYCVIISQICPYYLRAIELGTGNVKYFNFNQISFIEDIYP